jgi:hypothetical protein
MYPSPRVVLTSPETASGAASGDIRSVGPIDGRATLVH